MSDIRVGIQWRLNLASVSPVITASTPGMASAFSVWMAVIFAWAKGLRTMSMWTMPGSLMSST